MNNNVPVHAGDYFMRSGKIFDVCEVENSMVSGKGARSPQVNAWRIV
jgi:hypothetical protein